MNQHDNTTTRAAKAKTTQALSQALDTTQSVIKSSDRARATLNEILFASQNRKAELEVIIQSLQGELADELRVIDATEAAISVIEQRNAPRIEEREPVEMAS